MRVLALLLILPLAGCPALDTIEGKPSPYKEHVERVALVVVPEVKVVEPAPEPPAPEPVAADEPEPLLAAPECASDIFRVSRCVDGKLEEW